MIKESYWLVAAVVLFSAVNVAVSLQCFLSQYGLNEKNEEEQNIRKAMLEQPKSTTFSDFPTAGSAAVRIQNDFGGPSLLPFLLKTYARITNLQACSGYDHYGNYRRTQDRIEFQSRCYYNCQRDKHNCEHVDKIFFLEISFCKLEHILQNSFSFVPSLDALNLTNNAISTIEQRAFDNLECLKQLDLSYNRLDSIKNLTLPSTLKELKANNNQISKWDPNKLSKILKIDLSYNRFSGNLTFTSSQFFYMTALKLNNNNISAFEWIESSSKSLKELDLAENRLENFKFSAVHCYQGKMFITLPVYSPGYSAVGKDIYYNDAISTEATTTAATTTTTFNPLLKGHVCKSDYLITVQDLNLSHNNLTENGFSISNVSVLNLDLSFNKFKFTADFITGLPVAIQTLNLSSNNEIEMISRMFAKHFNLTNLSLEYLNISDLPKNVFYNLTQLKTLSLAHNQLTTFSFSSLSTVTNLSYLDVSFNQLKRFDSKNVFTFVHLNLNVDHNPWTCEIIHRLRIDLKFDNIFVQSGNSTLTASNHVNGIECEEGKHSIENLGSTNASGLLQLHDYMREVNETIFTENKKLHDIIELNSKTNDSKSLRLEIERKLLALQNNVSLEMQSLWANKSGDVEDAFLKLHSSIMENVDYIIKQNSITNNSLIIDELRNEIEHLRNNFSNFKNIEKSASNQSHTESVKELVQEFKNQLLAMNETLTNLSKKSEKNIESTEEFNRFILERVDSMEAELKYSINHTSKLILNNNREDGEALVLKTLEDIVEQKLVRNNATFNSELMKEMEYLRGNLTHFKNQDKHLLNQTYIEQMSNEFVEKFQKMELQTVTNKEMLANFSKKSEENSIAIAKMIESISGMELTLNTIRSNEASEKFHNFSQSQNISPFNETLMDLSNKSNQNSEAIGELIKSISELKLKTNESKITEKVNGFYDSPEFQLSVNRTLIDLSKKIDQNSIAIGELIKSLSNLELKFKANANNQVSEKVNGFFDNSTKSHNRELTEQLYNLPSIVAKIQESLELLKHNKEQKTSQNNQVIESDPSKAHYNSLNHVNEFLWTKLTKNDRDPKTEHTDWPLILLLFIVGIIIILAFITFFLRFQLKKMRQTMFVDEMMLK